MVPTKRPHPLEFWAVTVAPWVLDALGGRAILATLFGAVLWGFTVAVAAVRPRTADLVLRRRLGLALGVLSCSWLMYWGLAFFEIPRRLPLTPESARLLLWFHAGLLSAGLGMVIVLGIASFLWLLQHTRLRKRSWERRAPHINLPSLESLSGICQRSVQLAFSSWGLGFTLAVATAVLRWSPEGAASWVRDPKVLVTGVLWLGLAGAFQLSLTPSKSDRWLYRSYAGFAVAFMVVFACIFLAGPSQMHERLPWFR